MREVVSTALELYRNQFGADGPPSRLATVYTRQRDASGKIQLATHARLVADPRAVFDLHRLLEHVPGLTELREAVASDADLSYGLLVDAANEPITEPKSQANWLRQFALVPFLSHFLRLSPRAEWDEHAFRAVFADLYAHARREPIPIEFVTPLRNFESELERIDLDPETAIASLSEETFDELVSTFGPGEAFSLPLLSPMDMLEMTHALEHGVNNHPSLYHRTT